MGRGKYGIREDIAGGRTQWHPLITDVGCILIITGCTARPLLVCFNITYIHVHCLQYRGKEYTGAHILSTVMKYLSLHPCQTNICRTCVYC